MSLIPPNLFKFGSAFSGKSLPGTFVFSNLSRKLIVFGRLARIHDRGKARPSVATKINFTKLMKRSVSLFNKSFHKLYLFTKTMVAICTKFFAFMAVAVSTVARLNENEVRYLGILVFLFMHTVKGKF
jgi:hypothetical protein